MALTNKQRAFVEYYTGIAMWNAKKAAELAGYAFPKQQGSRLLSNVDVNKQIQARLDAIGAVAPVLKQRWLTRSRVDISPYVTESGLDVQALKEAGLGYLIKGVRETKDAVTIILRDPDVAEDRLAKAEGMYVERHEVKVNGDVELRWPDEGGVTPVTQDSEGGT